MTSPTAPIGEAPSEVGSGSQAQLDALDNELSELRDQLEDVDYRVTVVRLLIAADDQQHLEIASADLEGALMSFRSSADIVVARSASAAAGWGVPATERTLSTVVEQAPEQWRAGLREHTAALVTETARLRERLMADPGLVSVGHRQVSATLELLLGDDNIPMTYDDRTENQARLVDHLA